MKPRWRLGGLVALVLGLALTLAACAQLPTPTPIPCSYEVCPELLQIDPSYAYQGWRLKVVAALDTDSTQVRLKFVQELPTFDLLLDGERPVGSLTCAYEGCAGNFSVPDDVNVGTHRISVEGGSTLEFEVRGPHPPKPSPDWTQVAVPARGNNPPFYLHLPPGWELESSMGYDSYVAWIRGTDDILLMLGYGDFWGQVITPNDASYSDHEVIWEPIDGYRAQLVWPKEGKDGVTGVFIDILSRMHLTITTSGEHHLTAEQKAVLLIIFRSIRGL